MVVAVKVKGGNYFGGLQVEGATTIQMGIVQNTIMRPRIPIYRPVYKNSK